MDREDATDPYQDYFGTGVLGGLGGGLRTYAVLESKPYKIELDLNDWFRFDLPGHYRLYLKSHRLTRERVTGESGERTAQFAAVSDMIDIEILAEDADWRLAKLNEIRAVLDQAEPEQATPGAPPVPHGPLSQKIALVRRELRYLGSLGAVQLSFEDARKTGNGPDALLLVGARDRPQMLGAFDRYLADSQVGVGEWDIRVRALFTLLQKDAPKPLPIFMWQFPNDMQKLLAVVEARQERFQEIVREEAIGLIAVVSGKDAVARQISAEAIASLVPDAAKAAGLIPPDDDGLSREELIAHFLEFAADRQSALLGEKWDLVRGPEMIPSLRAVIGTAKSNTLPNGAMPLQVWGLGGGIAESALRRLNELSPEEAARIVRSDVASGKPRFASFAVREFPAQNIPEADDSLSALLKTDLRIALPLVAKFGTVRLASQIRERYAEQSWPCAEEESFVSYFVRTVPGEGKNGGGQVLQQAMANRERRGCYRWLLNRVASVVWNRAVQAQASATLDDSDPEAAVSAAQVLAAHGDASVEPLLWKRLERWSERWQRPGYGARSPPCHRCT
ncbi:MAG TPA: hypothetical protein VEU96_23985 [Bryobacteraceae bacterium]|nr:hypothetical protein [Bryobacteraceae bacterium]